METLNTCPVCKDYSETPHQLHYGGIACFSCRAFFRRAHQETKTPNFKCKKNGECAVTVKTRRKCQKCRYELCLKIGMKPSAVLTSDQKKKRFRNAIQKKINISEAKSSKLTLEESLEQLFKIHEAEHLANENDQDQPPLKKIKLEIEPVSVAIIRRFVHETGLVQDENSKEKKLDLRQCFFQHLTSLTKLFYELSFCNIDFLFLSYEDQTKLLLKNSPLFVQYMLTQWVQKSTFLKDFFPPALNPLTLKTVQRDLNLFENQEQLLTYGDFVKSALEIEGLNVIVERLSSLVAVILFQYDEDNMTLTAQDDVHFACEKLWTKCEDESRIDLANIILTCEDMATFFADNVQWTLYTKEKPTTMMPLQVPYNQEEEYFFRMNITKFDMAWNSVRFGDAIMENLVQIINNGATFTQKMAQDCSGILHERFWIFANLQREFKELPMQERQHLWKNNCWSAIALASVYGRSTSGAIGQAKMYATPEDWKYFESRVDKGKGHSLIDLSQNQSSAGDEIRSNQSNFHEHLSKVANLVQNKELFKYFCLVFLFNGHDKIQKNLINALRRKLNHDQDNMGNKMITTWNHCINDVKKLATMYAKIQD